MKQLNIKCKCVFIPNMLENIPKTTSKLTEKRIVSVGRLSKEKGYIDLIEVFKKFHEVCPEWRLDIVGDGSDRNKIVDRIYEYKLTDFITVHGYKKKREIDELLNKFESFSLLTKHNYQNE